jgi:SAM-dependent methyltransferase
MSEQGATMRQWLERMKRESGGRWALATTVELSLETVVTAFVFAAFLVVIYFPYSRDEPPSPEETNAARRFYNDLYAKPDASQTQTQDNLSRKNEALAGESVQYHHVQENVEDFVQRFNLRAAKALDVGSGTGYLQDVVEDYTGFDISSSVRRYYHKPFVEGSATAMPFSDNTFGAIWTIWVLEHVINPEQALQEIRRVSKDRGLLYLAPAWDVASWASQGYDYRPYSDFGTVGKILKASVPVQGSFQGWAKVFIWPVRLSTWKITGQPTSFRYHRLVPNYVTYLGPDSDAVNSLDRNETALWFVSRGDECLNCKSIWSAPFVREGALIIRVHKRS